MAKPNRFDLGWVGLALLDPPYALDEDHRRRARLRGEPDRQREGRAVSRGRAGGDEGDVGEIPSDGQRGVCRRGGGEGK